MFILFCFEPRLIITKVETEHFFEIVSRTSHVTNKDFLL